jgi:hypothetical protein
MARDSTHDHEGEVAAIGGVLRGVMSGYISKEFAQYLNSHSCYDHSAINEKIEDILNNHNALGEERIKELMRAALMPVIESAFKIGHKEGCYSAALLTERMLGISFEDSCNTPEGQEHPIVKALMDYDFSLEVQS